MALEQSLCFGSLYDLPLLPGFHRFCWQNTRDKVFQWRNEMAAVNSAVRVILHLKRATFHLGQEQFLKNVTRKIHTHDVDGMSLESVISCRFLTRTQIQLFSDVNQTY